MKRSEFLKRGGMFTVAAVVAPKLIAEVITKQPVASSHFVLPADLTTIRASCGGIFSAGEIVRNCRTGEAFMVTSVDKDTLTVVRGIGSIGAKPIKKGDDMLIISSPCGSGAELGDADWMKTMLAQVA